MSANLAPRDQGLERRMRYQPERIPGNGDRRVHDGKLREPLPAPPRAARPLPDPSDWSFELIERYHEVIRRTAQRFGLDTYPNQLEVITAEQMMDAYASVGMPVNYRHWSYGKEFIATEKNYKRGHMGLAYEIVINSNPCISYLMEENTMAMQALVIAHAAYGHNSFFKGNYLFRMWTDASSIIDYLVYAKNYVAECEERHGLDAVETLLDSCHALANHGVDRYRRPQRKSLAQELAERTRPRGLRAAAGQRPVAHAAEDARQGRQRAGRAALPGRAAGEPALLHREERAAARTLAARDRAHRAQGRAVLLPAAADPGDERGLGHVLAPQAAEHDVRRRLPHRRRDDRVAEVAHQRGLPAAGRANAATAASTRMRWVSRCTPTSSASATTRPTRTAPGSPTSPARPGCRRWTRRCATSRTRVSSAST